MRRSGEGPGPGFDNAVADRVAQCLPTDSAAHAAWLSSPERWSTALIPSFLERVRTRLRVRAEADSAVQSRIARLLAARADGVRWGSDAEEEFRVRNDPDIQAALGYFGRLKEMLAGK